MKHIKLFEQFVNEDKIQNALDNIDKWMPEDSELQDEYYQLINAKDEKGMEEFLDMYADEDRLMKYGIKFQDLGKLAKAILKESVNEATETAINQLAKDEQAEGYDAKVFLGKFDGQTFKAQSTDKTWQDGVPVMKNFSRNGFKPVSLKGEYQLVDSDRGWWYIQGPKNTWYAVKHADYGTPPFEY